MGYTTEFTGSLKTDNKISVEVKDYINLFSETRHMKRDETLVQKMVNTGVGRCWKNYIGTDGEYFLKEDGEFGQSRDDSILNYNAPGGNCPGLWCQWIIDENNELCWDGGEKFYSYIEWLQYLIDNFFEPEGIIWNGMIHWQGEDYSDKGTIKVINNKVDYSFGL